MKFKYIQRKPSALEKYLRNETKESIFGKCPHCGNIYNRKNNKKICTKCFNILESKQN